MKKSQFCFLIILIVFGSKIQTKAQGNLTFVGPVHYTCDFIAPYTNVNPVQRVPIDTIVVPTGHVVKLEGDNICRVDLNGVLRNHTNSLIYGALDLKISGINKATILNNMPYPGNGVQSKSYPMWLGPGVHYVYFSNNTNVEIGARYSLHGLLFLNQ